MTKRAASGGNTRNSDHAGLTLDHLPLFAADSLIGAAVIGPGRACEWPAIASLLETRGLPKIDELMGGRYVPAVRVFSITCTV
jgi:hypothetical protein